VVSELGAAIADGADVVGATRTLIEDIRLYDDLRMASTSMAAAQRLIDNVEGLFGSLTRFAEKGKGKEALAEYLRMLSLESSNDDKDRGGDKVVLTTLHGAKGLEFPVCFVIGLEEELLPHLRTLQPQATDVIDADHATDISEERRLCYVGITRAQRKLYLTRACTRDARPLVRGHLAVPVEIPTSCSRFAISLRKRGRRSRPRRSQASSRTSRSTIRRVAREYLVSHPSRASRDVGFAEL
jgi:superfamily I DNA/RNA helicase